MFSALEVFFYENALYKFTFDIDIDVDIDIHHSIPYILAYKSQNLRQNLDLKVGGATCHKVKNFFQPPKYAVSDRVEPRDFVLLCDVVPLRRGTVTLLAWLSIAYY